MAPSLEIKLEEMPRFPHSGWGAGAQSHLGQRKRRQLPENERGAGEGRRRAGLAVCSAPRGGGQEEASLGRNRVGSVF